MPTYWYTTDLKTCQEHRGTLGELTQRLSNVSGRPCKVQVGLPDAPSLLVECGASGVAVTFHGQGCRLLTKQLPPDAMEGPVGRYVATFRECFEDLRSNFPEVDYLDLVVPFCVCTTDELAKRYGEHAEIADALPRSKAEEEIRAVGLECGKRLGLRSPPKDPK